MNAIRAVYRNGRIEPEEPIDFPEGTKLVISLANGALNKNSDDDIEESWDNSSEGIAAWLKWYESLEPLIFTEEEVVDTEAWLKKMNEYSFANMDKGIEDLFR